MAKNTYTIKNKDHPRPGSKIRFHDGKEEVEGTVAFSGKKQIHVRHGKTGAWHKLTIVHEEMGSAPTNAVGTGNIKGCDGDPPGSKKSKFKIMKRKYPNV